MESELNQYLTEIEESICVGLISQTKEWVCENRKIIGEPTAEEIAVALLIEASTSDNALKLREIAFRILKLAGHSP